MITNIQSQVKAKRVQNVKQKFSKATDKMLAMSGMNGYGSTENFVEELKHHLKIAKVCDNDHLAECWGYEKVKLKDGKEWNIADTKTAKNLLMNDNATQEWADTVGIVTADGASMILSYNKRCNMTMDVNPQWDENQSTSTNCIASVFDFNGPKKPNMFDHSDVIHTVKSDIVLFNAGGLGKECIVKLGGKCYTKLFKPTQADALKYGYSWCAGENAGTITGSGAAGYGTIVNSTTEKDEDGVSPKELGIQKCSYVYDYWNAVVKKCGGTSKIITPNNLALLATKIYGTNIDRRSDASGLTPLYGVASSYELPEPSKTAFKIWSGEESISQPADGKNTYIRTFENNKSYWYWSNMLSRRNSSGYYALCSE